MSRRLRTPAGRLVLVTSTAAVAAVLLVGVALAEAGDGISATGASVDKVGWWHSKNSSTDTPVPVTVPRPPGVPAGTLAVGAVNGEPDKLTAIGILPDAATGDTITSFTLTIREASADDDAANVNTTAAKIVACPITVFWAGSENGTWDTRPTYDCTLASAPGTRSADGTWTFDLLAIGQAWVDPAGSIAPDGVVLVEDVASPESFQAVFATSGEGALVVALTYEPGTDTTDTTDTTFPTDFGGGVDGGGFDVPSFGSGDIPVGGLPTPEVAAPPTTTAQDPDPGTPSVIAHTSPNVLGNLPGGLVLAVPLFLMLLGLLTYSLGPAGEPAAATRQRGVSRALAARARAGAPTPSPTSLENV